MVPLIALCGCGAGTTHPPINMSGPVIFFVPGAGGDAPQYAGLHHALARSPDGTPIELHVLHWGAPGALFMFNLQDPVIHAKAEAALGQELTTLAQAIPSTGASTQPARRLHLVGHSAGCGVILGALRRLAPSIQVDHVILLSPSVSPGYDLAAALAHVRGTMHVFYSDRDTFWLKWRTGTFGTYDNIKTPAAGYLGFRLERLPPPLRDQVVQHPYDPSWRALGNDGGHPSSAAGAFVRTIIMPLLYAPD
jgi:hypothetical protein